MAPPTPAPIHHQNQMRIQMKTSPATFPSPVEPNSSKKQIKAEPASPPSTPPPAMVTSSTVQAGLQSLLKTSSAPSPTPPVVIGGGAPVPQPPQWNMIQGASLRPKCFLLVESIVGNSCKFLECSHPRTGFLFHLSRYLRNFYVFRFGVKELYKFFGIIRIKKSGPFIETIHNISKTFDTNSISFRKIGFGALERGK
ncbi:hypothetical protein CAEBREN_03924 [Caenorhabditis brenneri]|uniref:Uncharacterized protein n=1 Tax=Caenorhabditis brenneri TaxID=135651 RepID=G0NDG4_CAEBE|nr:hypothetical protein CAEBREN_03924 [Caenorhabditis brenneri]